MVELQSCASLVNASALCSIEQEAKNEGTVNLVAEIRAELQREREKNAELKERISVLEAQIQERHKDFSFVSHSQGKCFSATERSLKKFKRQKVGNVHNGFEEKSTANGETASLSKLESQRDPPKDANVADRLVSWMSMDKTQLSLVDRSKDEDLAVDCDDTDDSDEEEDCEEVDTNISDKNGEMYNGYHNQVDVSCSGSLYSDPTFSNVNQETGDDRRNLLILPTEQPKTNGYQKTLVDDPVSKKELFNAAHRNMSSIRKPPKVAFCPKEVKQILQSEALLQKNAQSHTIRKIIVFASLGIRHGCDDIYELDFNHFSIVRKGEPYVSLKDPGEHVLYENPGVRRKIFFPNHQNPTLCPVQILEEEKAMRPSDPSCPSCLFLCIKYGGRTRNLPQNEYVRQRMGRNKLKSFGPVMCRMAMLVHIRSGSFFFKALGITLLFMAGFPDDLVQRETKYRNLDLLQKYYRTDEDAEGEELFLPHPVTSDAEESPSCQKLPGKTISTKLKGKKPTNSTSKIHNLPRSSIHQSTPSSSAPTTQFGLMGYTSSVQPKQAINNSGTNLSYNNQTPYHIFPSQPANAYMPMVYWSAPPNGFPPSPYASTYGYQAFPSNYISVHPQPFYTHPSCTSLVPKIAEKNDVALIEADSDSDSSSSNVDPNVALASSK